MKNRLLANLVAPLLIFLAAITAVYGQSVQQSGAVTIDHVPVWLAPGVIGDGGSAASGVATSFGVTNNGGPGICVNSAPITGPYNQLCLAASTAANAQISLQNFGGATAQGLNLSINGTLLTFPSTPGSTFATITGPFTNNDLVKVNGSGGMSDAGISLGTGTSGGIPGYTAAGTLTSSGVLSANNPGIGGGAGSTPSSGTRSGNTTVFATTSGSLPSGNLSKFDASGNVIDAAVAATAAGVTAFLNPCVASGASHAKGLVPDPGATASTTRFLREDCTFTTVAPIVNIRDPQYGALCNYTLLSDGAMSSGSFTLSSASANFSAADVGKEIQVAGAGASGVVLATTITSFTDTTHVVLGAANSSGGAVSGKIVEYGTDDTTAINNAIAAGVSSGRPVYHPAGSCMIQKINATGVNHLIYYGDGINESVLYEWAGTAALNTATWHVFDLTGSSFVTLSRFQIGSYQTLAQPTTGIFIAQVASGVSTRLMIDEVYVTGQYSVAALYDYGVPSWRVIGSDFYNYFPGAGTQDVIRLTGTNQATLSSSFATVTSGTKSTSDIHFFNTEMHKFAGASANNDCVMLDTVNNIGWYGGVISGGCVEYVQFLGANTNVSWLNTTFETESQPVTPTNAFLLANASTLNGVSTTQSSYILGSNTWNSAGSGSLQSIKNGVLYQGVSTATLAQNTTTFVGTGCVDTSAAANCATYIPTSMTAADLQVSTTASPGGVQTFITTLMVNGSASGAACTITGSATTCSFQGGPTNIPAGALIAFRFVSSATANTTRGSMSVELIANN